MSNAAQSNAQTSAQTSAQSNAQMAALQQLVEVVAQLRSPVGGCPWDLAQTPQTLIPYVIEEAYEVVDAIRQGNAAAIADELGDLLLQVVLQAQIASETQQFDLTDVATGIREKLIRRHPHVFADVPVQNVAEVHENWEKIKTAEEQAQTESVAQSQSLVPRLSRYARSLPPLMAAMKISKKAAAAGFEWETVDGVWAKFQEELEEFHQAIAQETKEQQQAELGDLLFTLVNIARWYELDPSEALQSTNQRFIDRLTQMEAVADRPLSTYSLDELEALWQQAKTQLRQGIG
jgi:XTP/dITP diphosphohydrolase